MLGTRTHAPQLPAATRLMFFCAFCGPHHISDQQQSLPLVAGGGRDGHQEAPQGAGTQQGGRQLFPPRCHGSRRAPSGQARFYFWGTSEASLQHKALTSLTDAEETGKVTVILLLEPQHSCNVRVPINKGGK